MHNNRAQTLIIRRLAVAICVACGVWTVYITANTTTTNGSTGKVQLGVKSYINPDWLGDETDAQTGFTQMSNLKPGSVFLFDTDLALCGGFLSQNKDYFAMKDLLVVGNNAHNSERDTLRQEMEMALHRGRQTPPPPTTPLPQHMTKHLKYLQDCGAVYSAQPVLHLVFTDLDFSPLGDSMELAKRLKCYINILEGVAHGGGGSGSKTELVLHILTSNAEDLRVYNTYSSPLLKSVLMYGYVYKNIYQIPVTFVTHQLAQWQ